MDYQLRPEIILNASRRKHGRAGQRPKSEDKTSQGQDLYERDRCIPLRAKKEADDRIQLAGMPFHLGHDAPLPAHSDFLQHGSE